VPELSEIDARKKEISTSKERGKREIAEKLPGQMKLAEGKNQGSGKAKELEKAGRKGTLTLLREELEKTDRADAMKLLKQYKPSRRGEQAIGSYLLSHSQALKEARERADKLLPRGDRRKNDLVYAILEQNMMAERGRLGSKTTELGAQRKELTPAARKELDELEMTMASEADREFIQTIQDRRRYGEGWDRHDARMKRDMTKLGERLRSKDVKEPGVTSPERSSDRVTGAMKPSGQERETAAEKGATKMKIEDFRTKVGDYVGKSSVATMERLGEFSQYLSPEQKKEQWQRTKERMKEYLRTRGYKVDGPWEMTQGYGVLNAEFNLQRHRVEASGKFTPQELKQINEYLWKVAEDAAKQSLKDSFSTSGAISRDDGRAIPDVVVRRAAQRWLQGLDNLLHAYDQIAGLAGVVPGGVSGRGRPQRMPGETAWGSPLKPEARVRPHLGEIGPHPMEVPRRFPDLPKRVERKASTEVPRQGRDTDVMLPFEKAGTIRIRTEIAATIKKPAEAGPTPGEAPRFTNPKHRRLYEYLRDNYYNGKDGDTLKDLRDRFDGYVDSAIKAKEFQRRADAYIARRGPMSKGRILELERNVGEWYRMNFEPRQPKPGQPHFGEWGGMRQPYKEVQKEPWHAQDSRFGKKGELPKDDQGRPMAHVESHPFARSEAPGALHLQSGEIRANSISELISSDKNPALKMLVEKHGGFVEVEPGRFVSRDNMLQVRITPHELSTPNAMDPLAASLKARFGIDWQPPQSLTENLRGKGIKTIADLGKWAEQQGLTIAPKTSDAAWAHIHIESHDGHGKIAESATIVVKTRR